MCVQGSKLTTSWKRKQMAATKNIMLLEESEAKAEAPYMVKWGTLHPDILTFKIQDGIVEVDPNLLVLVNGGVA